MDNPEDEEGKPVLYLVRETKGTGRLADFRAQERRKILCGKRHFEDRSASANGWSVRRRICRRLICVADRRSALPQATPWQRQVREAPVAVLLDKDKAGFARLGHAGHDIHGDGVAGIERDRPAYGDDGIEP